MKQANPAPNKISKQSSSDAQHALQRAVFHTSRMFYFLFAILVFAIFTFLAHRQAPRPETTSTQFTLLIAFWVGRLVIMAPFSRHRMVVKLG